MKPLWLKNSLFAIFIFSCFQTSAQTINYVPLFDNSNFSKTIDQSRPVGCTEGSVAVTAGVASYTIPIKCPPGTHGVVSQIAVGYNSQAGNGIMGTGWSIFGLSAISRTGRDIYHDNMVAPLEVSRSDQFSLDGMRLLLTGGCNGCNGATYSPEAENFSFVTAYGIIGNSPEWFKVVSKDGAVIEYGKTNDSRITNGNGTDILSWRISKITDISGNYITFKYDNSFRDFRISEINYTGNDNAGIAPYDKISFTYAERSDKNELHEAASTIRSASLLEKITVTGDGGASFKTYQFKYGYDGIRSLLTEVIESDANNAPLNSTIFKYGERGEDFAVTTSNLKVPYAIKDLTGLINDCDVFRGDFDGDGADELMVAPYKYSASQPRKNSSIKIYKRYLPGGDGYFTQLGSTISLTNQQISNSDGLGYNVITSDFNGDGVDDILSATISGSEIAGFNIYYFQTGGTSYTTQSYPFVSTPGTGYFTNNTLFSGDFDGDKRTDYVSVTKNASGAYLGAITFPAKGEINKTLADLNYTNTFTRRSEGARPYAEAERLFVIDFDGDGKSELLVIKGGMYYVYSLVKANADEYSNVLLSSGAFNYESDKMWVGDFNGDGKTDLLFNRSNAWMRAYSTGKGLNFGPAPLNSSYERPCSSAYGNTTGDKLLIADFNGDGKSDILHYDEQCNIQNQNNSVWHLYYSRGDNSFKQQDISYSGWVSDLIYLSSDINGDGKTDFCFRNVGDENLNTAYFDKDGQEYLLQKITDGMGRTHELAYGNLSQGGSFYASNKFYTKAAATGYPLNTIQLPFNAVTSLKSPDGIGGTTETTYKYEDAKFHRTGRGFLGYGKIVEQNNTVNLKTESVSVIDPTYSVAYPSESKSYLLSTGSQIDQTTNTVSFVNRGGLRFSQHLDRVVAQNMVAGTTTTVSNAFDNYDNITWSRTVYGNAGQVTTKQAFEQTNTPVPARPNFIYFQRERPGQAMVDDGFALTYNANGTVKRKTTNSFKAVNNWVDYEYDVFGNVVKETKNGIGIAAPSVTRYSYENKGRFPIITVNSLGQSSTTTYNSLWGMPVGQLGIDGLITNFTYDGLGRLKEKILPEGYSVYYDTKWDVQNGNLWYSDIQPGGGAPEAKTWYDLLGRTIRRETARMNGQWATEKTTYDAKGNIRTTTNSYLASETPLITTSLYDDYNRISSISNAFGTTQYGYNYSNQNATVSATDPSGHVTSKTTDAAGKMICATDAGGTLNYTYDAWGNLLTVKQGLSTLITHQYDNSSRKISTTDLDAGKTTYGYDSYDRLITQTNPNNNTQTISYDVAGRITQKNGTEGISTYEYYGAGNGLSNQIKKITSFSGVTDEYTYDGYGRVSGSKKTINGQAFQFAYTYNNYGQILTKMYPSGYEVRNSYDNSGYLQNVNNNYYSNPYNLFSAAGVNGMGLYNEYILANGRTSTISFYYGFPQRFYTQGIQDLSISYDYASGNVITRKDALKNLREDFSYDDLNRLSISSVAPANSPYPIAVPQYETNYSSLGGGIQGNIISKTDVGNYTYKSHAVTYASNPSGSIATQTQDIMYTPFLQPASVSENGNSLEYLYDDTYNRVMATSKQNGVIKSTRYYLGDYELDIDAATGSKKYLHYISGGEGLCAIVVTENGQDKVYSVYKDHLGSILTLTDNTGVVAAAQNFDAWGRSRNPNDWTYSNVPAVPSWLRRGYTGHEHLPQFGLINMNARLYDPLLGRMLSPDNYVADATATQDYNRYTYARNNPVSYIDPDGNNPIVAAIIIGAVAGAYSGGVIANHGDMNPGRWDYNSGTTWKYMAGGAIVGGASGGIGVSVAGSGIPFANTAGIIAGSAVNSAGMAAITGGQSSPSIAIGAASFDFGTNEFGYLGKKGNKWYQNMGYAFGATANLQDLVAGVNGVDGEYRAESDGVAHARLRGEGFDISVSHVNVDHDSYKYWVDSQDPAYSETLENLDYARFWMSHIRKGIYYRGSGDGPSLTLHNLNGNWLKTMSERLGDGQIPGRGMWGIGNLKYGTSLFGCQSHVAHALWGVGVPTLPINFHPLVLYGQLWTRQMGIYAAPILINK